MYELFTLGGGTYLVDLLNAVAAITSGGAYVILAQIAGVAGLGWILFRTAFGGSWKENAKWVLLFATVWGAMIVPKATVRVVDRLDPALAPAVVANVPVGLALFASVTSQIGDGMTRLTEQAFTLPDDLRYQRHGLIFGSRLAGAATRLEVTDAVFARNLRAFARQCVFHALLLGHVTADDLRESTDLWRLVTAPGSPSAGASPARMFELATRGTVSGTGATTLDRTIVTCETGAGRLNAQWSAEIARSGLIFGRRLFPDARTDALARAELMAALPAAHDFLIGASRSAGEIMRQQMVLNAVHDAGEQWAAEAGNAAALRAYTEARAEAQTVSAYRAIGRQAETWVPLLRIVFECLYVGAFPMAVLLMLTPAGLGVFRSYVTGLVWLQSWGPLYAVLHRISMGEAAERMSASALMPGGDVGISLIAQAGIRAVASDVAVMSGYLSMSVPFLAAALAYGLSKATVLATSVLAVGQDAASAAAQEGTTGNISLGSTNADVHRYATVEGPPGAHLDACRHRPLHRLRPGRGGVHRRGRRHPDRRRRRGDEPHPRGRGPALGIARGEPREPRRGRRAPSRGTGRRRPARRATPPSPTRPRSSSATATTSAPGEAYARGGDGERERASSGARIALREDVGDRRHHQGADGGPHRTGEGRRRVGLRREAGRRRLGDVARADHREGRLEPCSGLRREPPGHGPLVRRLGGVAALFHRDGRRATTRASTRTCPPTSPARGASRSGRRSPARSRRAGRSRPRGCEARRRRSTASSASPSSPGSRSAPARTGAPSGRRARSASPRRRAPRTPRSSGATPRTSSPSASRSRRDRTRRASGGQAEYEAARDTLTEAYGRETAAAHGGWSEGVRDRAYVAGAPIPGEVEAAALGMRAETKADMTIAKAGREARTGLTEERAREGRAGTAVEVERPFEEHATENLPFVGEWLAGKLYGTAKNAVPDGGEGRGEDTGLDRGEDEGGGTAERPARASAEDRRRWRHGGERGE